MGTLSTGGGISLVDPVVTDAIVIENLADLPAPTLKDGVLSIVLEDNEYILNQDLSSAFPLAFPGSGNRATWKAINRATWTYTGTDSCFRDLTADGDIELFGLTEFKAPNGNMFDITTVSGSWSLQAFGLPRFTNCKALGTVSGGSGGNGGFNTFFGTFSDFHDGLVLDNLFFNEQSTMFVFGNNSARLDYDGQTVNFTIGETVTGGTSGATGVVQIDTDAGATGTLVLSSVTGTFQDDEALTGSSTGVAVVDGVLQNTVIFTAQGTATTGTVAFRDLTFINGANETIFDVRSEIEPTVDTVNYVGNMIEGGLNGIGLAAGSLDNNDPKVESIANTFIPDTAPDALLSLTSNATETIITTVNTPVLVAGTWVIERTSLFTGTTAGRATSNSLRDAALPVTIQASIEAASGTNKDVTMYVAVDGSIVASAKSTNKVGQNDPRTLSVPWQIDFTTNKFVEIFIENNSDTINLIATSAILRVR